MSKLKLRVQLALVALALIAGFALFGGSTLRTLGEVKVGGPVYSRIALDKDLVADILPPPNYIIESYLTALLLADPARAGERPELIARLTRLRGEYEARHRYWEQQSLPDSYRDIFLVEAHKPAAAFYAIADQALLPALRDGDAAATKDALGRMEAEYGRHRAAIDRVVKLAADVQAAEEARSAEVVAEAGWTLGAIFLLSLAVAGIANTLFSIRLLDGIGVAKDALDRMASGDLKPDAVTDRGDEIGDLLRTLATARDNLRGLVERIRGSAAILVASVEQMSATTTQVAASSGRQSDDVASVAATVEEMSVGISHMAGSADGSSRDAAEVGTLCERGSREIGSTAEAVRRLTANVENTSASVTRLGDESRQISDIVGVIRGIADQTNLLALNAAIEAARAGEQGRGFAVVADEVRKLAERTAQSTDQITTMIGSIQSEIQAAVSGMNESCTKAKESELAVQQAREAMSDIAKAADSLLGEIAEIASGLGVQREGSNSIATSVERISLSAVDNSKAMDQVAETARDLAATARGLNDSIAAFRS